MKNLYLTITDECNLHCPHCYKEDFKKSLFSFEKIKKILENNKDIDFIILYGGEFLLEKYSTKVIDLITFLKSKNLSISGTTNLCFKNLSENQLYILNQLDSISTSWNPLRFSDEQFNWWLSNINKLKGKPLSLLIALTKSLIERSYFDQIQNFCKLPFETIKFEPFIGEGFERPLNKEVDVYLCELYNSLKNFLNEKQIEPFSSIISGFKNHISTGTFNRKCYDHSLCLEVNGDLKICPQFQKDIENPKKSFFNFDERCLECKFFAFCKGNCPLLKFDNSGCPGYPKLFQRILSNGN